MGSANGGSDIEEAKAPKLEEEEEKKHEVEQDKKEANLLEDLALNESTTGVLESEEPAVASPAVPPPPPPPPAFKYHKLPLAPLGNPKAKHCYDK